MFFLTKADVAYIVLKYLEKMHLVFLKNFSNKKNKTVYCSSLWLIPAFQNVLDNKELKQILR